MIMTCVVAISIRIFLRNVFGGRGTCVFFVVVPSTVSFFVNDLTNFEVLFKNYFFVVWDWFYYIFFLDTVGHWDLSFCPF